jgi:hypothetical protein
MPNLTELTCAGCGERFMKLANQIKSAQKRRNQTKFYCDLKCANDSQKISAPERVCKKCGKLFNKRDHHGNPQQFCSTGCSNAYRIQHETTCLNCDKTFTKINSNRFCSRKCGKEFAVEDKIVIQGSQTKRFCIRCNTREVFNKKRICDSCYSKELSPIRVLSLNGYQGITLEDLKASAKNNHQFQTKLRTHSRKTYFDSNRPKICDHCGYNKHVDVCHIQDVKNFHPDTLITVVNSLDNLVAFCPKHHWEFDHNIPLS